MPFLSLSSSFLSFLMSTFPLGLITSGVTPGSLKAIDQPCDINFLTIGLLCIIHLPVVGFTNLLESVGQILNILMSLLLGGGSGCLTFGVTKIV